MKAKLIVAPSKTNKIRMFDILSRAVVIGETYTYKLTWRFELGTSVFSGKRETVPTLTLNFEPPTQDFGDDDPTEHRLKVGSEDWEFEVVERKLDLLDEAHKEEMERKSKRDFLLRRMTTEERDLLGHTNWRDSDPDGEAKVLAEKIMKAPPAPFTKLKTRSKA